MTLWRETGSPWALGLLRAATALLVWAESYASWRPPHHVDEPIVLLIGALLGLSSTAMLVGWHGRLAAGLTGLGMLLLHGAGVAYGLGGGGLPFATASTFELALTCILLSLGPCSDASSIDAIRAERASVVPLWSLALLRLHGSLTLGFVALGHLDGAWLSGERLARMLTARRQVLVEAGGLETGAAWLWVGLELLAVAAPWLPRSPWAVWLAAAFLLAQYPVLYTGTWSLHMAALVVLTARSRPEARDL